MPEQLCFGDEGLQPPTWLMVPKRTASTANGADIFECLHTAINFARYCCCITTKHFSIILILAMPQTSLPLCHLSAYFVQALHIAFGNGRTHGLEQSCSALGPDVPSEIYHLQEVNKILLKISNTIVLQTVPISYVSRLLSNVKKKFAKSL